VRAAVVVTGSELVRGDRTDLNGPYLTRALVTLGIEPAEVRIVGDDADELEAALRAGLRRELLVVSGGLGPTHDDRTVELLARAAGLALRLDPELEARIETISRDFAARSGRPYVDFAAGVRKQATLPEGALLVGLVGTAPAFMLELDPALVVVLPGPPRELQALWPRALELEPFRRLQGRATPRSRRVLRFYGIGESGVAHALDQAGGEAEGVEATICARDFEIHVDLLVGAGAEEAADRFEEAFVDPIADYLFGRDERTIEALVLERAAALGLKLATAESCTGGLVAGRLTAVAGASAVFLGGVVAYADAPKRALLGVSDQTLEMHGAVSAETAREMAGGARARFGATVAVSVTGIAGPGGGSEEKPVGLVYLCAASPDATLEAELRLPGDRDTVRGRATVAALHLVHRLLGQM
jgi:nicotinamide-nucleotide amidase